MLRRYVLLVALVAGGCAPAAQPALPTSAPPAATLAATALPPAPAPSATSAPATPAAAALWRDATAETIGTTTDWTNGVELADVNGDGPVDVLLANGPHFTLEDESPGTPQPTRIFLNQGPGKPFQDVTERLLGPTGNLSRVVKVRDLNGDGKPDILIGQFAQRQLRLFLGKGDGFTEVTATNLPQINLSVRDLEIGDVNGDGTLDIVLIDSGVVRIEGGRTRLWLNDGSGRFTDATATYLPNITVLQPWDVQMLDVDNDYDLDIAIACQCNGSYLFLNDGTGHFSNDSTRLPQYPGWTIAYKPVDLNGDGSFDLLTNEANPVLNQVFANDGHGSFKKGNADFWPDSEQMPGEIDAVSVPFDQDSDGHPDFLIGSTAGSNRLMQNDGHGHLSQKLGIFGGSQAVVTWAMAVADLNGDRRLDVLLGSNQGGDKVYFGDALAPDTAPPIITLVERAAAGPTLKVRARVHDNKTPVMPQDFKSVTLRLTVDGKVQPDVPMTWYGEALWRAEVPRPKGEVTYQVCATDAAGNAACAGPAVG